MYHTLSNSYIVFFFKIVINNEIQIYNKNEIYRSSGIVLENLIKSEDLQMSLFSNSDKETKKEYLSQCIDKLTKRFKKNIVKIGYAESPKNDWQVFFKWYRIQIQILHKPLEDYEYFEFTLYK